MRPIASSVIVVVSSPAVPAPAERIMLLNPSCRAKSTFASVYLPRMPSRGFHSGVRAPAFGNAARTAAAVAVPSRVRRVMLPFGRVQVLWDAKVSSPKRIRHWPVAFLPILVERQSGAERRQGRDVPTRICNHFHVGRPGVGCAHHVDWHRFTGCIHHASHDNALRTR